MYKFAINVLALLSISLGLNAESSDQGSMLLARYPNMEVMRSALLAPDATEAGQTEGKRRLDLLFSTPHNPAQEAMQLALENSKEPNIRVFVAFNARTMETLDVKLEDVPVLIANMLVNSLAYGDLYDSGKGLSSKLIEVSKTGERLQELLGLERTSLWPSDFSAGEHEMFRGFETPNLQRWICQQLDFAVHGKKLNPAQVEYVKLLLRKVASIATAYEGQPLPTHEIYALNNFNRTVLGQLEEVSPDWKPSDDVTARFGTLRPAVPPSPYYPIYGKHFYYYLLAGICAMALVLFWMLRRRVTRVRHATAK